jgi:hypothetical protein
MRVRHLNCPFFGGIHRLPPQGLQLSSWSCVHTTSAQSCLEVGRYRNKLRCMRCMVLDRNQEIPEVFLRKIHRPESLLLLPPGALQHLRVVFEFRARPKRERAMHKPEQISKTPGSQGLLGISSTGDSWSTVIGAQLPDRDPRRTKKKKKEVRN